MPMQHYYCIIAFLLHHKLLHYCIIIALLLHCCTELPIGLYAYGQSDFQKEIGAIIIMPAIRTQQQ